MIGTHRSPETIGTHLDRPQRSVLISIARNDRYSSRSPATIGIRWQWGASHMAVGCQPKCDNRCDMCTSQRSTAHQPPRKKNALALSCQEGFGKKIRDVTPIILQVFSEPLTATSAAHAGFFQHYMFFPGLEPMFPRSIAGETPG